MKYFVHYKFDPKNLDKVIELFQKAQNRPDPENYPKSLAPTYYFHNKMEGFTVYEAETEEQIINYHVYWFPLMESTWKSISESVDFIKKYKK